MKKERKEGSFSERAIDFFEGKGFYIILFLCVAVIGVSGYVLFFGDTGAPPDPFEGLSTEEITGGYDEPWFDENYLANLDPDDTTPVAADAKITIDEPVEPVDSALMPSMEPPNLPPDAQTEPIFNPEPDPAEEPEPTPKPEPAKPMYVWPVSGTIITPFSKMLSCTTGRWATTARTPAWTSWPPSARKW